MFYRTIVYKALKRTMGFDNSSVWSPENPVKGQSSLISQLIFDIFGGKILKTHKNKGWHFYNWIDGERIDFTNFGMPRYSEDFRFEDIPSTSAETYNYFEQEDYSSFYLRFISAYEETVVIEKLQSVVTA